MATATERADTIAAAALGATAAAPDGDMESDTPTIETPAYTRGLARWTKCRALMVGVEAIRAGGTTYLAQHPNESNARYDRRRVIAGLFNGFKRTVLAAVGLLTMQEPTLGEDMPEELVTLWENIDGAGTHGAVFTAKLATAGMTDGFAGILTEFPRANDPRIDRSRASLAATIAMNTGQPLDSADEQALGLRPYFILVKADAVLPVYEIVNGQRTLVMLVIKETATVRKGRFGLAVVTRHRVYTLQNTVVSYERWTETDGKSVRDEGPTAMRNITGIPWSPCVCGNEIGTNEYMPPLMDLADLNLEHHQIKTGILSLEDLACVPTPVRVGASPNAQGEYPPLVLGPGNTIEAPATEGVAEPVYWLAPPIDVLDPAMKSLDSCKAEMGAMGATFLAPQQVQETAAAKRMDQSAETATIATVSRAVQDCLESAVGFAGQFMKLKAGSVAVNTEFLGEGIDPAYLQVLVTEYQANALTLEELRYATQTGKLPEDFEANAVRDLIAARAAAADQAALAAKGVPT